MKEGGGWRGALPPAPFLRRSSVNLVSIMIKGTQFDYRPVNNDGPTRRVSSVEVKIGYAIVFE